MAKPPPLHARPGGEPPLDRALALAAAGNAEGALRQAAAVVKAELGAIGPLFAMGEALVALDEKEHARIAYEVAADRAADGGALSMAMAAIARLSTLGHDETGRRDAIARAYAKGSPQLRSSGAAPPPVQQKDVSPLPATLVGAALVEQAAQTLDYARAAADGEREGRAGPPDLPPQSLFSSFTAPALRALMDALEVRLLAKGEKVITEGAPGAEAFILARGELEVVRTGEGGEDLLLARLGSGAVFGEMALLSRSPRTASVVAARPSVVLMISVESLDRVAAKSPEVGTAFAAYCHRRMVGNLVRTSPLLGPLSAGERQALIERFSSRTFEAGEKLVVQGKESDGLHVISSGLVSVQRSDAGESVVIARLGVGEVVGEVSMVFRRASNADVVAEHPTMTLHLPRSRFMEIVREHPTLLAQLYELAARRDEETASIAAQEASDADDLMI